MIATMLATLGERRREIAILRTLGATIKSIFILFALEAFIIVASGILFGNILLTLLLILNNLVFNTTVQISYFPDVYELALLFIMLISAIIVSVLPALKSYKNSLQDGLMVKI
jgi:putative ABC transport system permease protein